MFLHWPRVEAFGHNSWNSTVKPLEDSKRLFITQQWQSGEGTDWKYKQTQGRKIKSIIKWSDMESMDIDSKQTVNRESHADR